MSWEDLKKAKMQVSKGDYVRLEDGERVVGVFRGEPYGYYRKFPDKTEYQEYAEGRRFRFKINFVMKNEDGEYEAKIFEGSKTLSEQLLDIIEKYSADCIFEIKRSGATRDDTRYTIMLEDKLTPEQIKKLEGVKLKTLKASPKPKDDDLPPPPEDVEEEIPF